MLFILYLFDKFISPNGLITKFSFVSPHVSRDDNQGNAIAKILLKDKEFKDRLILAPCNIGKHWVLLVINPDAEMIYYMDPLNGEPTKYQNLKTKFDK
ncbi:putative Ulp1 protease family catalytic domain-containing protein [Medicago truncatula]|uniref:Putative Ulp1 protease family catalytic domain-containing protein n=1 Tax=Medicago truncatula TaxID=3880 RepID=A0A396HW83_MEDTR|nr:putative Ulp1 protease family catalytic domain-containing protein [Medicago truncatula]